MRGRAAVAKRIMFWDFGWLRSIAEIARQARRSQGLAAATPGTEPEAVGHCEHEEI